MTDRIDIEQLRVLAEIVALAADPYEVSYGPQELQEACSPGVVLALCDRLAEAEAILNNIYAQEVKIDAAREADDHGEVETLKEMREMLLGHFVDSWKGKKP